ncbi:MAG: cupin domain-containing protein [Reichenbachiella sp.]
MKELKLKDLRWLLFAIVFVGCNDVAKERNDGSLENNLETKVFSLDNTKTIEETFGDVTLFTSGEASTYGTKNVTTGVLTILPNSEAHTAHKHVEEEYLFIVEGSGTWSLNGKEFPAKKGDLLYAAPWDMHGIFNSDTVDLVFYVLKWNNKGMPLPKED